jgi:putative DNA primase/helicase
MMGHALAKALGGSFNGKWHNIRAPGHSCQDRSLGFCFDPQEPNGIRINSLAGDDLNICRQYIMNKLDSLSHGGVLVDEKQVHNSLDQANAKITKALSIWHAALSCVGTPVENYLATRGCFPNSPAWLTDAVRFHLNCPMGTETVPAMVSLMRDPLTGEPTGVHRTALKDDGSGKRTVAEGMSAKMMLGRAKGAAVMLCARTPCMGIAEGIETALSAQKLFGMPVWACLSAQTIAGFPIIKGLNHLTIFADHDQAGIEAAKTSARRHQREGVEVEIRCPPISGDDWNSFLLKEIA